MTRSRAVAAGAAALIVIGVVGVAVAIGGDSSSDGEPASANRSEHPDHPDTERPSSPSPDQAAVAKQRRVRLTHFPPGLLTQGEAMTVPAIPLCPKLTQTPRCIKEAEVVVTTNGATNRRPLEYDPNQGYLVDLEPARGGELRYYIELTMRDGQVQRLPQDAPDEQFEVPVVDGGYEVRLPRSTTVAEPAAARRVAWGEGTRQIGKFDGKEGDDGGPAGFGVMSDGTVVVGDYVNSRLSVMETDGSMRSTPLAPAQKGTFVKDESADAGIVVGRQVSAVSGAGTITGTRARPEAPIDSLMPGDLALADGRLWVRGRSEGWNPVRDDGRLGKSVDTESPPTASGEESGATVAVEVRNGPVEVVVTADDGSTTHWELEVPGGVGGVLSTELTDRGDLVMAIATIEPNAKIGHTWVTRLTSDGRYGTSYIEAPWQYMLNGPQLQIDETAIHVMSGDSRNLRVDSYPVPAITGKAER